MKLEDFLLYKLVKKINKDEIIPWASMLTLYLLLSLFPMILILTEIISRITIADSKLTEYWSSILPEPVYDLVIGIATDAVAASSQALIPTAAVIALWSASRGMLAIIKVLNKAYQIEETRGYIHLRLLAFTYTVGLIMLILISLILVVFGNYLFGLLQNYWSLPLFILPLVRILRFALSMTFYMFFFVGLYNLSPTVQIGLVKVLPGALFSSLGIISVSIGFSFYLKYFSNLSYLYGSLTSIIILILWLFLVSITIMIGGEINAVFSPDRFIVSGEAPPYDL